MGKKVSSKRVTKTDPSLFFEPRSIAVIGSLKEGLFGGYVVIKSLLNAGYSGEIYPINPANGVVHGLRVYPSIKEVGADIDLAHDQCAGCSPGVERMCGEGHQGSHFSV